MADDTPELGRLVVLHGSVLAMLLAKTYGPNRADTFDEGDRALFQEIDALTMRIAHRSRSAANYHETERGIAALEDLEAVRPGLEEDPDATYLEIVRYTWDKDQLDNPAELAQGKAGMRRKLIDRIYVHGLRPLSPSSSSKSTKKKS